MTDRENRDFRIEIELGAPRDAVWRAISDDRELRRWFAPEASIDLSEGGEVVWQWGGHHRWVQRIEIVEPGARLRTRYDSAVDDGQGGKKPIFLDFMLEGGGGTTTLRLVQSGFGDESGFDEEYDGISRGWPVELGSLKHYLENHLGHDRRVAWANGDLDMDAAEVWRTITGPDALACGADADSWKTGQHFRFETCDGDVFEGRVLDTHPRGFTGVAESHGDGWLRVCAEGCGDQSHPWIWLAAYDRSQSEVDALQARWQSMLQRSFPMIDTTR